MNKTIATAIVSASMFAGGLVGVTQLTGAASAQTAPSGDTSTSIPADAPEAPGTVGANVPGDGQGAQRGPRGPRPPRVAPEELATALGVSTDDLAAAREAGQTLADFAASQGVSLDQLVDIMTADAQTHLAEEVASGELTQDEADARLADVTARVTERVQTVPGEGEGPGQGHGPCAGDQAPPADAPADQPAPAEGVAGL